MELTGVARVALVLLDQAQNLGLDRDVLLRKASLADEALRDPDTRIPLARIEDLWQAIIVAAPEVELGFEIGSSFPARELGIVGYTMTYSRTLGQALKRLARYGRIMSEGVDMKLAEDERQVLFAFEGVPRLDSLRHPVVARLVAILGVAREITGTPLKPLEVHFPYARPVETSRIATYFGCPLVYDKPVSGLVLGRRELELPIRTADETLAGYLDRLAEEVLQSLDGERRFSVTVRRAIWRELSGGQPSMGRIADLLHVSLRTLQRRLQQEGLTFAGVREALRREVAEVLLRNPDLAVYEVAFLLGYSEPSTFYRAFRRWHRISPREFRSSV